MAMTEKTRMVFDYLKEIGPATKVTAQDITDALGWEKKSSVDGVVTGMAKKKLAQRTEAEIELSDGSHKKVKFISLTDAGMAFDPDAEAPAE